MDKLANNQIATGLVGSNASLESTAIDAARTCTTYPMFVDDYEMFDEVIRLIRSWNCSVPKVMLGETSISLFDNSGLATVTIFVE